MASERHYASGVTSVGIARYTKINEPDTKGEYADGKYKTELVLSDDETKAFKKVLQAKAKEWLPDVKTPHLPVKTGKDDVVSFMFKSTKKPDLRDSSGGHIPDNVMIRDGSKIIIHYTLTNYDKGLSLWLEGVQLVELNDPQPAPLTFAVIEGGYVAPSVGSFAFTIVRTGQTDAEVTLARIGDSMLARATYDAALKRWPGASLELREEGRKSPNTDSFDL